TEEAETVARDVLMRGAPPGLSERMRAVIVRALSFAARYETLVDTCVLWLEGADLSQAERGRLLAAVALARAVPIGGAVDIALQEANEASAIAERLDDDSIRFYTLRALSHANGRMGRTAEQLDTAQRALALAEADTSGELLREQPHLTLAQAYLQAAFRDSYALGGDTRNYVAAAEHLLTEALRVREERGTVWDVPAYLSLLGLVRTRQGLAEDALAEAEAAIAAAAESGTRVNVVNAHLIAASLQVGRGDLDAAEEHIEQAEGIVARCGAQPNDPRRARLQLQTLRMQWERAGEVAWSIFCDLRDEDAPWSPYGVAFALVRAGRQNDAGSVAAHAEAWADRLATTESLFQARFTRAVADRDAVGLSQIVAEGSEAGGDTGVLLMAACVLAGAGRKDDAARAFGRCVHRIEGVIAERYTDIARSCGVPIRSRRRRVRATTGWDALTATELRVVDLAAQGLTNPQIGERLFLSRRTVQSHLSHVFTKLGISSRVELAAEVATRRASSLD
ncbi:MAG TPA: LuxR C-terminal-related transcriptional regulator, partial [Actinomycetota bacterium]|nr:LuxR C-terminal-related transcriptional regulator [Actinomycetota bacterium]